MSDDDPEVLRSTMRPLRRRPLDEAIAQTVARSLRGTSTVDAAEVAAHCTRILELFFGAPLPAYEDELAPRHDVVAALATTLELLLDGSRVKGP